MENQNRSKLKTAGKLAVAALLLLLIVILVQNTGLVAVHVLLWKFSIAKILLFFIIALIGFVTGILVQTLILRKK